MAVAARVMMGMFGAALLALFPGSSSAGEEGAGGGVDAWVGACISRLRGQREATRASATAALDQLPTELMDVVVRSAPQVADARAWEALEKYFAMRHPDRVLMALEGARSKWPSTRQERLTDLVRKLRSRAETANASAEKILAELRSTEWVADVSTSARALAGLGRSVIPHLLAELEHGIWREGMADEAAAEALSLLLRRPDISRIADLLQRGHLLAAPALKRLYAPSAGRALLAPLRGDVVSDQLLDALGQYADWELTRDAVKAYLARHAAAPSKGAAAVAEFAARSAYYNCVPHLERMLAKATLPSLRRRLAADLARLGHREAIPLLLAVLEGPDTGPLGHYDRVGAGWTLNWVTSSRVVPASPDEEALQLAAKKFRVWWEQHGKTLEFDRARGQWVTAEP